MTKRFTLIELLIVVAIIAILAAVIVPSLVRTKRLDELKQQGIDEGAEVIIGDKPMRVLEIDLGNGEREKERIKCRTSEGVEVWYFLMEAGVLNQVEEKKTGAELTGSDF